MKQFLLLVMMTIIGTTLFAQETQEKVMEQRAHDMHKAITMNSKDQWRKFISENYTQALIDRPMQAKVQVEENGNVVSSTTEKPDNADPIEAKSRMFERLHDDFGDSKISSLKINADKVILVLKSGSGMSGTFTLQFEMTKPYKIDKLAIEVNN